MRKQVFTILLSVVLTVSMCLAGTATAFAGTDDTASVKAPASALTTGIAKEAKKVAKIRSTGISNGGTIVATNVNTQSEVVYETQAVTKGTDLNYYITMPKAGTLVVKFYEANGTYGYANLYNTYGDIISSNGTSTADDGTKIRYYHVSAGTVQLRVYLSPPSTGYNAALLSAIYAPDAAASVKLGKTYFHGSPSYNTTTKFKVTVPSKGYLKLALADATGTSGIYAKTSGYGDYKYYSSSSNVEFIGVKKGTYTFTIKTSAPVYGVLAKFKKVKESKYGTKKKKAAKLKKKKAAKGLIITNAKKVHWYKFKNPKTQKVKIKMSYKLSEGGSYGGLKVSAYDKRGLIGSKFLYSDTSSTSFNIYTLGKNNKLVKGTYYLKVESNKKGNGYFTIKWQ